MQKLTIAEIIEHIKSEKSFQAVASDYSFTLKIDDYVPYVCAAVHNGHQFRKELWELCTHSEYERWYEEDPETKTMIQSHPIVISGSDSRFEYDLNRAPEDAIYDDAWGKKLWKKPLSEAMKKKSLEKHNDFYKVVHALIQTLELKFGCCVVYDLHSFNWQRWDRKVPTWNLGIDNIDSDKYAESVEQWRHQLSQIELPDGIESVAKVNDTFQGNGHFLKYITEHFKHTLVLATEVSKIYCEETTGTIFPEVVTAIENGLKIQLPMHAKRFHQNYSK